MPHGASIVSRVSPRVLVPRWCSTTSLANICKSTEPKVRATLAPVASAVHAAFTQASESSYAPLANEGAAGLSLHNL